MGMYYNNLKIVKCSKEGKNWKFGMVVSFSSVPSFFFNFFLLWLLCYSDFFMVFEF